MDPVVVPLNVSWFSAGVSSAVATKLCINEIDRILYTHIDDQHPDTLRFLRDCEEWFGRKIEILQSHYKTVETAILMRGYGWIKQQKGGAAACTTWLKQRVRKEFEATQPKPLVYFWGMDVSESKPRPGCRSSRVEGIRDAMPKQSHRFPLVERGIGKEEAHQMLAAAGIKRPAMYDLGYHNNNCIGCVKGGKGYWNKIRVDFPEVFAARAALERKVNSSCLNGVFLDELDPKAGRHEGPICGDCGIMCEIFADAVDRHNPSHQPRRTSCGVGLDGVVGRPDDLTKNGQ